LSLLLVLGLVGCGQGNQTVGAEQPLQPTAVSEDGVIVAFGDSLTEGQGVEEAEAYPALLADKLQAAGYNYQVINAGASGETSSGALSRVDWMLTLEPDIVILETGGNDSLRGIDLTLTEQNIDEIITRMEDHGITVVLAGMQTIQNMGQSYTEPFREIYPTLAEKHNLILIPFFLEGVAASQTLNQPDGIHPTADGYKIVVETVYPYVVEAIERTQSGE
jgi:acyl-CoA thioesterase-1